MKTQHMTTADIKREWAEKLLSGEELTAEDREQIAYELGCTSMLEAAYRLLCKKLWLQSKPSTLKLSDAEKDVLSKAFPQRLRRGNPGGVADETAETHMLFSVMRHEYKTNSDCYEAIANYYQSREGEDGEVYDVGIIQRRVDRAKKKLALCEYDHIKDDLVNNVSESIRREYEKILMKNALNELSKA